MCGIKLKAMKDGRWRLDLGLINPRNLRREQALKDSTCPTSARTLDVNTPCNEERKESFG
jgi:hypothetical protein